MKNKQTYPKYLDALLTKTFYPETSSEHQKAKQYIESSNKRLEKNTSKTSTNTK